MIICDVCWCVVGRTDEYEDLLDRALFWIGKNCICPVCYERYSKQVEKDSRNTKLRKN